MENAGQTLKSDAGAASSVASGNFDTMVPTMPEDTLPPSAETLKPEGDVDTNHTATDGQGDQSQQQAKTDEPAKTGEANKEADQTAEPFHKHPRFQEIIGKNKALETQLAEMRQQMDMLVKGRNQAGSKPAETQDSFDAQFAKIQEKLEEGEISVSEAMAKQRELIEENSKSTMQQLLQEQARETEVKQIQSKFFQENQDFVELRDSGELQKIIDSNPLHDPLSAYYAHKAQQSTKAIEEAVTKAVKETEDRLRKEFTSKRNAASLGSGAAHVPNRNESPELNDPNKFGGKTAVLANRLRAMRQGI